MIVLTGSASERKWRPIFNERPYMGMMLSPTSWRRPWSALYACDNDVFAHRDDPAWWCKEGERRWLKMLDKIPLDHKPLFVLLPDIVADWRHTVLRAYEYRQEVRSRRLPVALALQDGCNLFESLSLSPDYVFIGGTKEWKWRNAERITTFFHEHGLQVHIGRVNGPRKVREALRVGADSIDGTGFSAFSREMLPPLFRELDGTSPQTRLGL